MGEDLKPGVPEGFYEDITFAIVVWNDAERLRALLEHVRPWFDKLAVVVQKSPDHTLGVAMDLADIVVVDKHHGFGDASFGPQLLPQIDTTWTFKVDCDEWPTEDLLNHLGTYVEEAEKQGVKGVWIPFRSWVEGNEYTEQHGHLRLFHTSLGWPATLHSRPPIENGLRGEVGFIEHRRTLDEMMSDYINYYRIGKGNPGWDAHNTLMMKSACSGVASRKGWKYVRSFPWWPDVRDAAFGGKEPEMTVFCTGATRNGTRMIFDIVTQMGQKAIHAVQPGYGNKPDGSLDLDNPVWTTGEEWESKFGKGEWITILREDEFAAKSAIAAGRVKTEAEYLRMSKKAAKTVGDVGGLVLIYEEVVADPQHAVDVIAEFLGVPGVSANGIVDANEKYRSEKEEDASTEQGSDESPADERVEGTEAPDANHPEDEESEEKEA